MAMRRCGIDGDDIHVFADNSHPPYNPVLGTYLASGATTVGRCFPYGFSFYKSQRVHAHLGQAVVTLDPTKRVFETTDGGTYRYDQCLVATGASCYVPNLPGVADPGILTVRTLADAIRLKMRLNHGVEKAVVVGASFVGMRVLDVLRSANCHVTLVDAAPHVLPRAAHPCVARRLEEVLRRSGVEVRLSATLESIENVGGYWWVQLPPGQNPLRGNVVILCMGVRPNLSFLRHQETMNLTGTLPRPALVDVGLLVDDGMATCARGLFAAGDVAQALNILSGRREVIPSYANGRAQGAVAGARMAGRTAAYPGSVPHNVTQVLDRTFFSVGTMGKAQFDVVCNDGEDTIYLGFRDGQLCEANGVGRAEVAGPLRWLITAHHSRRWSLSSRPGETPASGELVRAAIDRAWYGLSAAIKEHTKHG